MCSQNDNLISIVTPVYNAERFIEEAIKSVISQSYRDWELLLIDDCSTDTSKDIIRNYTRGNYRIRYARLNVNSGAAIARNQGIEIAQGRYLAFLDSDDLWEQKKLELQLKYMRENNYHFTYTMYEIMTESGEGVGKYVDGYTPICVGYYDMLKKKATMGCSTVMIDRKFVNNIKMPQIRTGQDYALWLSILRSGHRAYCIRNSLTKYRIVRGSISRNKIKKALRQWQVYREIENIGVGKSVWYFVNYAWRAVVRK